MFVALSFPSFCISSSLFVPLLSPLFEAFLQATILRLPSTSWLTCPFEFRRPFQRYVSRQRPQSEFVSRYRAWMLAAQTSLKGLAVTACPDDRHIAINRLRYRCSLSHRTHPTTSYRTTHCVSALFNSTLILAQSIGKSKQDRGK